QPAAMGGYEWPELAKKISHAGIGFGFGLWSG
ncbi:MAG: hypothetical protein RIS56_735, partial [Verrucomicrobiota bacterium]